MKPSLHVFTLALNSMPWIERVAESIEQTRREGFVDVRWTIVHGVAEPLADTAWCKQIETPPDDGTKEFLDGLATFGGPKTQVLYGQRWPGKTAMCNAALETFDAAGCGTLVQMDSDEVWAPAQLRILPSLWERFTEADAAMFHCRYWLGPNRYVATPNAYGNNSAYEWIRAWRWQPGQRFERHEPPILANASKYLPQQVTAQLGLVFDHYAYATREQVAFKEAYYGYEGAVAQWDNLNAQTGPQDAARYLSWVRGSVMSYEA